MKDEIPKGEGLWKQLEKNWQPSQVNLEELKQAISEFYTTNEYKERVPSILTGEGGIRNIIELQGVSMFLELVKQGSLNFYGNWNWTIHNRLEHDVKNYTIFEEMFGDLKKSSDI